MVPVGTVSLRRVQAYRSVPVRYLLKRSGLWTCFAGLVSEPDDSFEANLERRSVFEDLFVLRDNEHESLRGTFCV